MVSNPKSYPFIEQFILYYQKTNVSNYFLCWNGLIKLKASQNEDTRIGHSWILYQKFIDKDAYIHIDCISDFMRDEIKKRIQKEMENVAAQQRPTRVESIQNEEKNDQSDIFEELQNELENVLSVSLFKPFFQSQYYSKYQEVISLEKILDTK